jgi:hypothetical protein
MSNYASTTSQKTITLEEVYEYDSPATLQIMYTPPNFPAQPPIIYGTGYLVGHQGYFITADHLWKNIRRVPDGEPQSFINEMATEADCGSSSWKKTRNTM